MEGAYPPAHPPSCNIAQYDYDSPEEVIHTMFTYEASASSKGNENIARVCNNSKCGGTFYIRYGADNYKCPHCKHTQ